MNIKKLIKFFSGTLILVLFLTSLTGKVLTQSKTINEISENSTIILSKYNTVTFSGPVTYPSVAKAQHDLISKHLLLNKNVPLYLIVDSPGGSIEAGFLLIETLKGLESRKVNVVCLFCASMGFQFLQSATGERVMPASGYAMAHKASGTFQGEFPGQIDSRYNSYLRRLDLLDSATVARSNGKLTLESFRQLYENEYWCTGSDCKQYGLIDKIVNVTCDSSLLGTRNEVINTFFGKINVVMSDCPIIVAPLKIGTNNAKIRRYINEQFNKRRIIKNSNI